MSDQIPPLGRRSPQPEDLTTRITADTSNPNQDQISGISEQLENLDIQNKNSQSDTEAYNADDDANNDDANDEGASPEAAALHGSTKTLQILSKCPKERPVAYSTGWYQLKGMKESTNIFLVCSRCYVDHIKNTPLIDHFDVLEWPESTLVSCSFWIPRLKDTLWQNALATLDIRHVRAFMEKRVGIKPCQGRQLVVGDQGITWYGMANGEVPGFTVCEACFEDRVAGTTFTKYFAMYESPKPNEERTCDMSFSCLQRAIAELSKNRDWQGFVNVVTRRVQMRPCTGEPVSPNYVNWYVPSADVDIPGLTICEACYSDKLAFTQFGDHFERYYPQLGIENVVEHILDQWKCGLGGLEHISTVLALNAAQDPGEFGIFEEAARTIRSVPTCTAEGQIGASWWTLTGGCEGYNVCHACFAGIFWASGWENHFEMVNRGSDQRIICDCFVGSPRFKQYDAKITEAGDLDDIECFIDFVKTFAAIPVCPQLQSAAQRKWWGYPEALFCEECYIDFVSDTSMAEMVPIQGEYIENSTICQVWSPRMRTLWLQVCAIGESESSSEYEAAVQEFREIGRQRFETYWKTVPRISYLKAYRESQMKMARAQAHAAISYKGAEGMVLAMGSKDQHLYGNSSLGWFQTSSGAMAAQATNSMMHNIQNSGRVDVMVEWSQLRHTWSEVE